MNKFQSHRARLIYRWAVIRAQKAHKETGGRYFVIPVRHPSKFLMVVRREDLGLLHKKKWIDFSKIKEAYEKSFYFTAGRDGKGEILDKQLPLRQYVYQIWYEQRLKDMPRERRARHLRWWKSIFSIFKCKKDGE